MESPIVPASTRSLCWPAGTSDSGRTAQASIVSALREAIFSGEYQSGHALRQETLARKLGVSRIPIREALQQLEMEGLVSIDPNRGAFVTPVDAHEVEEITELRLLLEPHLLALAIPRMSNASLGLAEDLLLAGDREVDQGLLAILNWQFHRALYESADRPSTIALLESIHLKTERYMRLVLNLMQHHERSQLEHRQILEACRNRDVANSVTLLQAHVREAGANLALFLSQHLANASSGNNVSSPAS
jgi:DNA-binding GntR family transcriptional regulator